MPTFHPLYTGENPFLSPRYFPIPSEATAAIGDPTSKTTA